MINVNSFHNKCYNHTSVSWSRFLLCAILVNENKATKTQPKKSQRKHENKPLNNNGNKNIDQTPNRNRNEPPPPKQEQQKSQYYANTNSK